MQPVTDHVTPSARMSPIRSWWHSDIEETTSENMFINRFTSRYLPTLVLAVLFSATLAAAQGAPGQSSGMSSDQTGNAPNSSDRLFVKKAIEGGNAEVQLGQLAEQKAQSPDVKQFAQKMVHDHMQLGDDLKPIAQRLSIEPPTGISMKDKMFSKKLEGLSGNDFDREYMKAMVKDHQEDLRQFRDEENSTQDPNLKQAAEHGASVISQHLQLAEQIAQQNHVDVGTDKSSESSK